MEKAKTRQEMVADGVPLKKVLDHVGKPYRRRGEVGKRKRNSAKEVYDSFWKKYGGG